MNPSAQNMGAMENALPMFVESVICKSALDRLFDEGGGGGEYGPQK